MSTPSQSAPDRRIWVDGALRPWAEATVHVMSHSMQRGSLVFDFLSVHETPRGAAVFRLDEHLERFAASNELVGLPQERGTAELRAAVLETVRANPGAKCVKICAYLPSIEIEVVPMDARVSVSIAAYDPVADIIAHNAGTPHAGAASKLWIEKERRNRRADILPPQAKVAANYTSPMVAKWRARKNGYDDILLVDEDGFLAEAPTCNVFLVDAEGTLRTPPEGRVLLGVTRRTILDVARHDGRTVREEPIRPDELFEVEEAFLTATTAGVLPVASVDGKSIGTTCPGPVTKALGQRLHEVTSGADPAFHHWLAFAEES